MDTTIIETNAAPAPIGPYSQAVKAGNILFISGQVALDATTGLMCVSSIGEEATKVMSNLQAVLTAAGVDFSYVVKTTIFLSDMELFAEVNEVYSRYFTGSFPARETVAVKGLPKNAHVEISMTAYLQQ